jgi:VanZ family protein
MRLLTMNSSPAKHTRNIPWLWLAVIWAGIIMFLSFIPGEDLPTLSIWEADKWAHAFVYAVLSITVINTFIQRRNEGTHWKKAIIFGLILCILFGWCIELIQGQLLPSRTFDVYDLLANFIGCLLGVTGIIFIFKPY